MFQVRIHGRGGQGVVTAAELLAVAAFNDGRHAQAFPSFGSERTGAPVVSFCRISEREIRTRSPIEEPDALVIQDATLLHQVGLFSGLKPQGYALVNTTKTLEEVGVAAFVGALPRNHVLTVRATEIALQHLGRPLPNAVLLGGFAALTGVVSLAAVVAAIEDRFSGALRDGNVAAVTEAFNQTRAEQEALAARERRSVGASSD
ncbi:MAG: 2-oxoacid:acceptor oxidoreductase family protein [Acidimicrobiales bacterium]